MHIRLLPLVLVILCTAGCGSGGGGGGGGVTPPSTLLYATTPALYETETAITPNAPTWNGGTPDTFAVTPALPAGLSIDTTTGVIAGTTTTTLQATTTHTITATNAGGAATTDLDITVGVLDVLAAGYAAEVVADGLTQPAKFALAPDGRIYFNELSTGDTRVILPDGTLQAQPFAHSDVITGPHQGLLGVVVHPDYGTNGWVYVMPCVSGSTVLPDRTQVLRYTASPGIPAGTNQTLIVDDLPISAINNGGDLVFGIETPEPRLYVSIGDTEVPALAQTDGSLAGRILRYTPAGVIPTDNPIPGDPEWCRGLRNTFCIDVQPQTGDLFGADNGDAANDELNYLNKGKNFEWGGSPPPGPGIGIIMRTWVDVIVPTGIAWHDGTGWGASFANDLFLSSYDDQAIRRFQVSGLAFLDIDSEDVIAHFIEEGIDNKPLNIEIGADGSLYVSTFTGLYRISRP